MKIITDYSIPENMINLIESKNELTRENFNSQCDFMNQNQGFKYMLQFYDGVFTYENYKDILYLALNNQTYSSDNGMLMMLYENLKRINSEVLIKKLTSIKSYNFESMLHRLELTLPTESDIELNLFFVFDGINAASIYGEDTILINTMFWPSDLENEKLVEDVLLHEYHHIGIKYWLRKSGYSHENRFDSSKVFIEHLTSSIVGEGAATYLFTKDSTIYPLIKESHGEEVANNFRVSVENRTEDIRLLLESLNHDLLDVLNTDKNSSQLSEISNMYSFDPSGKEPLDKTIGYYMCKKIDEVLGRDHLLECFKNTCKFYQKYNATVNDSHDFRFSEELTNEEVSL